MANITILGCGYGAALAIMLDRYGHKVTAWSKFEDEIKAIQRDNEQKRFLPGVPIAPSITLTADVKCVADADIVITAVPSKFMREAVQSAAPYITPNTVIVNGSKGLEDGTFKRLSEVITDEIPNNPVVSLTGPSHAEEIARNMPTTIVAACSDINHAKYVQKTLQNENFRVYTNDDIIGCELGGSLKNIIALTCGIAEGMGLGDNIRAAIMTRGIAEIARVGVSMGAKHHTFSGLTGIGDLIVTCTSMHSRNRRAGLLIGGGISISEAVEKIGTVEGYDCTKAAYEYSKKNNVEIPITDQMYSVLYENCKPKNAIGKLMKRPYKSEQTDNEQLTIDN